jgi:hypothetical protein
VLTATLERSLRGIWKFATAALVDGKEVCGAEMMVAPQSGTGSAAKDNATATAGAAS